MKARKGEFRERQSASHKSLSALVLLPTIFATLNRELTGARSVVDEGGTELNRLP
jgi:hypothetical protein